MKKIKVGLTGASGRMGQAFQGLLKNSKEFEFFVSIGRTPVEAAQHHQKDFSHAKLMSQVDVWIDFSSPELFSELVACAMKHKTPVVCGTTGFDEKTKKTFAKVAKKIPLLWSGNMSFGIQVVLRALESFSDLANFDFQIEEIHHNKKKDAPSGTGLMLKKKLDQVVQKTTPPILSIRGGGVFGVHKILAMSDEEVITIEHSALNRNVFARGALIAAKALVKKKAGLYSLSDVI